MATQREEEMANGHSGRRTHTNRSADVIAHSHLKGSKGKSLLLEVFVQGVDGRVALQNIHILFTGGPHAVFAFMKRGFLQQSQDLLLQRRVFSAAITGTGKKSIEETWGNFPKTP